VWPSEGPKARFVPRCRGQVAHAARRPGFDGHRTGKSAWRAQPTRPHQPQQPARRIIHPARHPPRTFCSSKKQRKAPWLPSACARGRPRRRRRPRGAGRPAGVGDHSKRMRRLKPTRAREVARAKRTRAAAARPLMGVACRGRRPWHRPAGAPGPPGRERRRKGPAHVLLDRHADGHVLQWRVRGRPRRVAARRHDLEDRHARVRRQHVAHKLAEGLAEGLAAGPQDQHIPGLRAHPSGAATLVYVAAAGRPRSIPNFLRLRLGAAGERWACHSKAPCRRSESYVCQGRLSP